MKHLDLFSGIGGFALAARWVGIETVQFVEIEPFAQKVLNKNFPNIPIHDDIKTFKADEFSGIGIVTGGYPCQPFSQAGQRRGEKDDRHLWPEMFRVIREARPVWVLAENVAGHVSMGLDDVLDDLESEGYTTQPIIIPACAKDAKHRRDRVWIVANSECNSEGSAYRSNCGFSSGGRQKQSVGEWNEMGGNSGNSSEDVADSDSNGWKEHDHYKGVSREGERTDRGKRQTFGGCSIVANSNSGFSKRENKGIFAGGNAVDNGSENVADSDSKRGCSRETNREDAEDVRESSRCEKHGYWLTEPSVGRVAHGIPRRVDRLRGLGNAIVPQVAYEIMKGIYDTNKSKHCFD